MTNEWKQLSLGDAFTTATGTTPPKSESRLYGNFMPLVKPPELRNGQFDTAVDGLSQAGVAVARTLPTNSILVSCIGNLGNVGMNTVPVAFNQQINAILPDQSVAVPVFMLYQTLSPAFQSQLVALGSGTTISIVNKSKFNSIQILLPPLSQQQRIVAILDEAFAGITTAKANAEKNIQNARALFEGHLQSVFTQHNKGWVEHTLRDLVTIQNGYAFQSASYTTDGHFVIRIGNVQHGEVTFDNPRFVKLMDKRLVRFILEAGDILISLTGNIGRVGIIRAEHLPAVLNQRVARITVKDRSADRNFIFRFLSSQTFRESLQDAGHGAAQQNVSTKEIESVKLSMPSKTEQHRIVEEFDVFATDTQRLESIYTRKLAALDELKQSLLHQAFSGQL